MQGSNKCNDCCEILGFCFIFQILFNMYCFEKRSVDPHSSPIFHILKSEAIFEHEYFKNC